MACLVYCPGSRILLCLCVAFLSLIGHSFYPPYYRFMLLVGNYQRVLSNRMGLVVFGRGDSALARRCCIAGLAVPV